MVYEWPHSEKNYALKCQAPKKLPENLVYTAQGVKANLIESSKKTHDLDILKAWKNCVCHILQKISLHTLMKSYTYACLLEDACSSSCQSSTLKF